MCEISLSRRALVTGAATVTALAAAPAAAQVARAQRSTRAVPPAPTKDGKSALNPDQALQLLKDGNAAFLRGEMMDRTFRCSADLIWRAAKPLRRLCVLLRQQSAA